MTVARPNRLHAHSCRDAGRRRWRFSRWRSTPRRSRRRWPRSRSRVSIRSSRTSCSRWTTPAAWDGISCPTTSRGSPPASRTAATASNAAARRRARDRVQFQPVRSAGPQRELQRRVLRRLRALPAGQEGGRHRPSVRRLGRHVRRAVDRRLQQRIRRLSGCQFRRHHRSHHRLSGHRLVLEDRARPTLEKQTADSDGSVCRRNGRAYSRRDGQRKHDAGDRRRLQLPERLGHVLGHREVQVRQRLHAERQSVLLHDLAGPVLLGQGRRRLGHVALRRASGTRRPTSTFATAPARRRSIRRPSRASTSSRRASSSTEPPRPIPAVARTRRR